MRGDGGNHYDKLGLKRISCASQFTIHNRAGTSPDPASNNTDTRSSQSNQASRTLDFLYPLVSSTLFSSSSPISLFLVHNSTIIAELKVKSSRSISPCHDHEMTPSTAYTEYKHTLSKAYTEYSIHRVQHTPSTAYTEVQHRPKFSLHRSTASTPDCLSSLHSHNYELTPECSVSFPHASLHDRPPSASSP